MKVRLRNLAVRTRLTTEEIGFSDVTFIFGPVGTGKSTVARLIDYCLGGELERTPAIRQEFVSAVLDLSLGEHICTLERGAEDSQAVRATWSDGGDGLFSIDAPFAAAEAPLVPDTEVYNLSDLLFHLCGVTPIKVLRSFRDPDSPLIRLSFRDVWRYCYLDQAHLDSSFYRLEDPFRGRKSQDAMRFFTGLHSERLNHLQSELYRAVTERSGAREAVLQIRSFMARFNLSSEVEISAQIEAIEKNLKEAEEKKNSLERNREASIHPTDELRGRLRELSQSISEIRESISSSIRTIAEQEALRAELITTKIKAVRAESAGRILSGADYSCCPQCGTDTGQLPRSAGDCRLCGARTGEISLRTSVDLEILRRELSDRIDQISDSINRRKQAVARSQRELAMAEEKKTAFDRQLQDDLRRYDSAFVESIRAVDREIAELEERIRSLKKLQEMPRAVGELEERAGASQGKIDHLRSALEDERSRLRLGDENTKSIARSFKRIMLSIGFPGVSEEDDVVLDPRDWQPAVAHSGQEWSFWDTGSGGKKTLFNVCYALALHEAARSRGMPVPNVLVIDSPTKNISDEENPEIVNALYQEIYRLSASDPEPRTQFLLIDSDFVEPTFEIGSFSRRRMAGDIDSPRLVPYYTGP